MSSNSKYFSDWDASELGVPSFDSMQRALSSMGPTFAVDSQSIEILDSPDAFYNALLRGISESEKRVIWSTLYVGTGEREQSLMDAIASRREQVPALECYLLMDANRATRSKGALQSGFIEDIAHFASTQTGDSRRPVFRALLSRLPERVREAGGVHHMKAYVFDDCVLLSGANLNGTYLTNRLDRYLLIRGNRQLADCICDLLKAAENMQTANDSKVLLPTKVKASAKLTSVFAEYKGKCESAENCDTWVTVGIQYPKYESLRTKVARKWRLKTITGDALTSDSRITSRVLAATALANANSTQTAVHISSAYLNLHPFYRRILSRFKRHGQCAVTALTSAEECNSFYKAPGLASVITPLYSAFADDLAKCSVSLWKYSRPNWTFHAKGVWAAFDAPLEGDCFALSVVGSSNLNKRAVHLDSELSLTVLTRSRPLVHAFDEELRSLKHFAFHYNSDAQKSASNGRKEECGFFTKALVQILKPIASRFM